MAMRHRRVREISRFLSPLFFSGDCYQQSGKKAAFKLLTLQKPIANYIQVKGFHGQRLLSTIADVSHEPAAEIDLLSFLKDSLDEFEGTNYCWLNRSGKNKPLFGGDGTFLVLAARNIEHDIIFEKLKTIQMKFKKDMQYMIPHIFIMGFNPIHSSTDQLNLAELLLTENITVPILLSQQTFPEIEKGACYILFKKFQNPVIYQEMDMDLEILYQAIRELQMQSDGNAKSLTDLIRPSWLQSGITEDQYICHPFQNLLLSYPGCVSADETDNRLFFSDCNHHRIIVSDGNGEILDCIGSSPGFEDGDFESARLRRPAGSYYHADEDCLYFVDSENHAIRKADMGLRQVETLYPTRASNKGRFSLWNWVTDKLGLGSSEETNDEEASQVFDPKSLYFPWHLLKSADNTLHIIDRRFQTLWTMDFGSGKIDDVYKGSPTILEVCGQEIMKNLSILDQIPRDWFRQQSNNPRLLEGLPHSDLLSSLTTLQHHIFICDTVGQRILKVDRESGVHSNFQLSNFGILGLPYWLNFPLETCYAAGNGLLGTPVDHLQHFEILPGRLDIHIRVDIPTDIELVEPLQDSCIWRQARGAATEVSAVDDVLGSLKKVGVAQQWYDELDNLVVPQSEISIENDDLDENDKNLTVEDGKVRIDCNVCTSPGTSEVIIYAALHCKLAQNSNEGSREKHAARLLDILSSKQCGKTERDLWNAFLLQSKGDLRDLIFTKPLHIRIRLATLDQLKEDNGRDIIVTNSSINVNVVALN
ncbi:hypothetical protein TanjilG_14211 [Lupinus angustifolius]|uniref:Uncharacterized protein n=1 Tax=Lupinus angustifolius TaxID=3871 RepID=A0A1J7GKT1_LUPAN|nr:PREDICTED: uncharacterized protein LOC109362220 [Lupinus angustifolius]OIW01028.1 hypothetical protein TanjilG_14211 [Lupinus angustifolius]